MRKLNLLLASVVLALGVGMSGTAWAHQGPAPTDVLIEFDPVSPVVEGTMVDVKGKALCDGIYHDGFCDVDGKLVTVGNNIQIQQLQLKSDSSALECSMEDDGTLTEWVQLAKDMPATGEIVFVFDTTGLGGMTIGFRTHYTTPGGQHAPASGDSDCADLEITEDLADPFPDGATTFTQGFYGASPVGEPLVDDIINNAADPEGLCLEINGILDDIGAGQTLDCSVADDRELILAAFLTGDIGPGADDGFLPSGGGGIGNLAAQKITLLLNLDLAAILTGDDIPMQITWFLNIHPLLDLVDGVPDVIIDPVLTTEPKLCVDDDPEDGDCEDVDVLNDLGMLLEDLDEADTTVEDILVAADLVLADPLHEPVDINGVLDVTADELTQLLGCINEAFDEGVITGVVTAITDH